MAKCPKCNQPLAEVRLSDITVNAGRGKEWSGVVYTCPLCDAALSVGVDPVSLKDDTVREIIQRLRAKVSRQTS